MSTVTLPQESLADGRSKPNAPPASTDLSAEHTITGAVMSATVMVWLQVAELPQASVARQVRVALKVLPQAALVTVPSMLMVPSLVEGASKVQAEPHSTVLLATQVITGAVVSTTVTA